VDICAGAQVRSAGREPEELMREVQDWIEAEMRRLDPEAYPEASDPGATTATQASQP